MCCIVACQSKKIDREIIDSLHYQNSDGAGICWFNKQGKSEYTKWLYPYEVENKINSLELPFVIHFRESSIGMSKTPSLCHPFEVSINPSLELKGEAEKLLIHNGTLLEYKIFLEKLKIPINEKEPISDTRAIAMILGKFYEDEKHIKLLTHICNTYANQRFVLVDSIDKKFKMFGDFTFEDGCWYSNMKWKSRYNSQKIYNKNNYTPKPVYDLNLNVVDSPELSPLYSQMNKLDQIKYLKKIKEQDNLNGATTIKTGITCCFCACDISADRLNRCKILGYLDDEISCLKCAELLHYTLPFSQEFKRLVNGSVVT